MMKGDPTVADEFVQRMRKACGGASAARKDAPRRRAVAKLLDEAEKAAADRRRVEKRKATEEKARREQEAAAARSKYLDKLVGSESSLWKRIDALIATKQPQCYTETLTLLADLRDLGARNGAADFRRRLEALHLAHARKHALIKRLHAAGL